MTQQPIVVARLVWDHNGNIREDTYGPWTVEDDWPHQAEIAVFLRAWCDEHGPLKHVTLSVVQPPVVPETLDPAARPSDRN